MQWYFHHDRDVVNSVRVHGERCPALQLMRECQSMHRSCIDPIDPIDPYRSGSIRGSSIDPTPKIADRSRIGGSIHMPTLVRDFCKPRPTNPGNPTTPPLPLPSAGSIKSRGSNAVKAGMEWEGQLGGGGDRGRRELQGPQQHRWWGMRPRPSTTKHPNTSPFQRWATRTSSPPPHPLLCLDGWMMPDLASHAQHSSLTPNRLLEPRHP